MARFDDDTALSDEGGGVFVGGIDPGWWIERGPNGGYVAAIALRALTAAVADPARTPRSLTMHYLAPPVEGPVRVETTVERAGRSLTFVSGRMLQGERLVALALSAFSTPQPGGGFRDVVMPGVPPPEACPKMPPAEIVIPMRERYELRWAIGPPPMSGGQSAVSGGWIRLAERRPIDHPLVAAVSDAWLPPVMARLTERVAVPTVDLTIHFRTATPADGLSEDDWLLVVFRSNVAAEGFVEEDGEVWSPDGRLLAHSRQLSVLMPVSPA